MPWAVAAGELIAQEHKVSSKLELSLLGCRRTPVSWRISLTDTISRLALISGTRPRPWSMRRRSNWKLRPCGRFYCSWPPAAITFWAVPEYRNNLSSRWTDSASGESVEAQRSTSARRVAASICCHA